MSTCECRVLLNTIVLSAVLLGTAALVSAQTPTPTPNPAAPPGTETQNPAAPPAVQQPSPQAPPGQPVIPGVTQPPTGTPSPSRTPAPTAADTLQEPREPNISLQTPKPLPPLPDMSRLGVASDATLPLSLNDAIKKALENNNDIEVARDDVRFAETQLRAFEGVYDPIFSITPQYDKRIAPQQSSLGGSGSTGTTSTTTYSLSPQVNKQFGRGGGNYNLSFANTHTNTSSSFSLINPFYSSNLALTYSQPLLRNRSIDNNRRQIRIQKKRLEQSDADFRNRTIQVITQVQQAYWELVFALRDQQNQLANLNLSRENLKNVEAQIAAGAKAPLERAEVQTELANRESSLLIAVQNVSITENNLKVLIFKDPGTPEWSAQILPTETPKFESAPINLTEALKEASENRPELRRLRLQNDITTVDLQYFKNQTRPQIDLVGTLATTGLAGKQVAPPVPPGTFVPLISGDPTANANAFLLKQIQDLQTSLSLPRAIVPQVRAGDTFINPDLIGGYAKDLSNLFGFKTRNVTIGVAISLPFHNTTAKAQYAGARIQQEQLQASMRSQEQLIEIDVRNSAQAVETARRRVLVAREARINAELQLEGEQRLYQVGRSTTFLLFQRENTLTNARAQELRAETDYNKALADLQRATSTTLRINNVIVDSPLP
jgi:outer membrane protein